MFIPRHSVVEDQFCSYAENSGFGSAGAGNVVAYAGSVVYLDPDADNEEAMVKKMANGVTEIPFGFTMQKVKVGYHSVHPTGFYMPGDLGSSDVIANPLYDSSGNIGGHKSAPVGVAHLGIFDTVHYTALKTSAAGVSTAAAIKPGESLFAGIDGRVTNSTVAADSTEDTVTAGANVGDGNLGSRVSTVAVARVVKGASIAKASANINNTTLYPIRIKLLV